MAPGDRDEVTNGELMRALTRLESNSARLESKVDRQGDVITSINLRVTTIEATQTTQGDGAAQDRRRSMAKPVGAGLGLGATLLGLIQWAIAHWRQ